MKKLSAILVIVMSISALLLSGCGDNSDYAAAEGDTVSVYYTGTLEEDGSEFDSNVGSGTPLTFEVGAGQMISGFDAAVVGMKKGDTKIVTLQPEEAYGETDPSLVITVDRDQIPLENLAVGQELYYSTGQYFGIILDLKSDTVTIDRNFKLAGKVLVFEITMDSITPAK